MAQLNILALTDHSGHSSENALYRLLATLLVHPNCAKLDVATRGLSANQTFFAGQTSSLTVSPVVRNFKYSDNGDAFQTNQQLRQLSDYDAIWLRLPPPIDPDFLLWLKASFSQGKIINDPEGILLAGSKEFLLRFPSITPRSELIESLASVEAMRLLAPMVLKPLRGYGGKGIVRIDGERVWEGAEETDLNSFRASLEGKAFSFLGMEYLTNVGQGDKRIVVVDGQIMGASLRLPAKGSWLCNVAAGGTSNPAQVDADEIEIVKTVDPILRELGIVMYGVDTLVDNDGRRVLSELNVTSIGGLPQIERMEGKPLVRKAIDLIVERMR